MEPREPVGLVLIALDTARADRLSPYGLGDVAMPALERLAREGVVFDQATTVAPLTLPAHTSLLTGLLPPRHGVRENASAPLSNGHVTLAEILEARGFRTGAFVGSILMPIAAWAGIPGVRQRLERQPGAATIARRRSATSR